MKEIQQPPSEGYPDRPDILTQQITLAETQARHSQTLEEKGILGKGMKNLSTPEISSGAVITPDKAKAVVAREVRYAGKERTSSEAFSIRFKRYENSDDLDSAVHYRDVTVAEKIGDQLLPRGKFTEDDAQVVSGMVEELRLEKAAGSLPNLDPSCTKIWNPYSGLMAQPPNSKE